MKIIAISLAVGYLLGVAMTYLVFSVAILKHNRKVSNE